MVGTASTGKARRSKGFRQAGALVETRIRKAGESRGFAVSRLLTRWADVVGEDIARIARPVEVSYGRGGFGATLVLLSTGSNAPVLQMQERALREKINACYGYAAIARIRITQTAPVGFSDGQARFEAPSAAPNPTPAPRDQERAVEITAAVGNEELRQALERLGAQVLSKSARDTRRPKERLD